MLPHTAGTYPVLEHAPHSPAYGGTFPSVTASDRSGPLRSRGRYLTGAGIAKSSARIYRISLTTWG